MGDEVENEILHTILAPPIMNLNAKPTLLKNFGPSHINYNSDKKNPNNEFNNYISE